MNRQFTAATDYREIVRCRTVECGAYNRPRPMPTNGMCPACRRELKSERPSLPVFVPVAEAEETQYTSPASQNDQLVKNVGQRIRNLRESHGLTQGQLQHLSRVSRSYLSRIESGQMTPSLGTLEKIDEALGCTLGSFFRGGSDPELLLEDKFIREIAEKRYLRKVDREQWRLLLNRLEALYRLSDLSLGR